VGRGEIVQDIQAGGVERRACGHREKEQSKEKFADREFVIPSGAKNLWFGSSEIPRMARNDRQWSRDSSLRSE
jgi:hypothetical protein